SKSWDLPRDKILSVIPESLLAQALQTEPNVEEIKLEHPDVAPGALDIVAEILEGKEPHYHQPNLSSSAKYLNLPWLVYYESPLYDQVEHGASYDTPKNRQLLLEAIQTGQNTLMGYLLQNRVSPLKYEPPRVIPAAFYAGREIIP